MYNINILSAKPVKGGEASMQCVENALKSMEEGKDIDLQVLGGISTS